MKDGETPSVLFSRGCALRSRRCAHGMIFPDVDANQHFARNLSPAFGVQKRVVLTNAEFTYQVLEDVVLSAYGEMEMSRE